MRRLAALAAALVLPALVLVGSAGPVAALEQDPILVTAPTDAEQTYTVEYDATTVVGNEPSGEFHTPADCQQLPTCAAIPLRVTYPAGYDRDFEEYFITVEVSWNDADIEVPLPGSPAGQEGVHQQGNDLDTFYYVPELNEDGETEYRLVAQAATGGAPERARWLGGEDEYWITVSNFAGVNTGFTVAVTLTPSIFGNPVEDLGTRFGSPGETGGGTELSDDFDFGSDFGEQLEPGPAASAPPAATPAPVFATNDGGLPIIGADGAADTFGAFGGSNADFEAALDGTAPQLFEPARQIGPPEDVPAGLVAFWLGLVPLALAAAAGVWLWRRRPTALSFSAPSSAAPTTA